MTPTQHEEIDGRLRALYAICLATALVIPDKLRGQLLACLDSALFDVGGEQGRSTEFSQRSDEAFNGLLATFRTTLQNERSA